MASITSFIRNTPVASLRAYFNTSGIELPMALDWEGPEPDVVRPLLQAVDEMDDAARGRVLNDADRVGSMSDDAGQVALYSVVADRSVLDGLANPHDRALWMFLNQRTQFQHAEEVRFTDERRRGRSWDGFICVADCIVRRDPISIDAFRAALRERFASNNIHVDIFERVRPTFDGEDCDLVQITVYREGLPDDHFAFDDDGELVRRAYRPVFEAAMTYEPSTGVIEVVANDRESRSELAQFVARHLLGVEFSSEKVPMRQYDLSVLRNQFSFPTDLEDGIERVDVRQLRLMPIDHEGRRVTLENTARAGGTIWDMADEEFGASNPLLRGWVITQAKLAIKFCPKGDARRGRSLTLAVTMPHGCNLKDQTEQEQLIGEKYLRRWGILVDDQPLFED
jgi:hypothetical protein